VRGLVRTRSSAKIKSEGFQNKRRVKNGKS